MTKETTNINNEEVNDIKSDIVVLKNSSANNISCTESASLNQSGARNIYSNSTYIENGIILKNQGKKADYNKSFILLNDAEEVIMDKVAAAVNICENIKSTISYSLFSHSNSVKAKKINTGILFAKNVNGRVVTLFDNRTAAIFGLVTGVVMFMLSLIFKRK